MDLLELETYQHLDTSQRHPWEQARLAFVYQKIKKYIDSKKPVVFLDVGCGDTYVAEALLEKIPNSFFYCVDTAFTEDHLSHYAEKYTNQNIFVFDALDKAIAELKYEVNFVLLLDVIEHVKDDIELLKTIKAKPQITSATSFVITVPAFESLFTNHDTILGHFRRYTNKTLTNSITTAGLTSTEKGYFFMSLLIPRSISKLKEAIFKPKSKNTSIALWRKGKLITNLFKNILIFDFKLSSFLEKLKLKPIGLSNYMICRKPVS